jgi:hypothetical protein
MAEFGYASFKQYVEAVVLPNSAPGSSSSGTYQTVLRRLNGLQYNLYALQQQGVFLGWNVGSQVWGFLEHTAVSVRDSGSRLQVRSSELDRYLCCAGCDA